MKYTLNKENFGFNKIDDEFVAFDSINDKYHIMNESACDLINILLEHGCCSLDILLQKFNEIYEINQSELKNVEEDITNIMTEFEKIGLVIREDNIK